MCICYYYQINSYKLKSLKGKPSLRALRTALLKIRTYFALKSDLIHSTDGWKNHAFRPAPVEISPPLLYV